MGDNLKQKTLDALTWSAIDRFGQQIIQVIIGIIVARLLSPDDYGLMGMIMIFAALSFVLVESGFGQALIRKKDASEIDFNTIFYFNILISIALYVLLYFLSPAIARFFHQPQLIKIGRIIFISLLFNAFYLVPFTQKVKEMDFKSIAKINIFSVFLSGSAGVTLAILKFGVWALVIQQISFHFFRMIGYHFFVKWKPKKLFSFSIIKEFWSFSVHILGSSILTVIFNNLYVFILGKYYQRKDVGYYSQANKLSETVNFTFQQILGSTYSMFSQIQDNNERLNRIFKVMIKRTALVTIPVIFTFIVIAYSLIYVLLSAKWLPSVPYVQILCLAALFNPFYTLNINVLNARGKSKTTFRIEIIKKGLILLSAIICFKWGIFIMLGAYAFINFLAYLLSLFSVKKEIHLTIKSQIETLVPGLLIGLILALFGAGIAWLCKNLFVEFFVQLAIVCLLYFFIIRKYQNDFYNEAIEFVQSKVKAFKK
ncbi:MAG: lipopolysaccharide biosynthesis protein [Paludibacteraceae bacterium]|nr:lipopolysaccharide biosynthesis protein [Paludibacteraceae bacterium]HOK35733.1 lipopolysaccharide biosynthesis protein [Paludibacteraceae bacterium]